MLLQHFQLHSFCLIPVSRDKPSIVPSVGSIVICRVTCITSRFAKCVLISVDGISVPESFKGMIRKEDIRATEKDKVEVHKVCTNIAQWVE